MENIYKLFGVLEKWKNFYILAGVLLALSSLIRMLEPKILQIAIDGVVVFAREGTPGVASENDFIAQTFYSFLPEIRMDNLIRVLFLIGIMFLIVAAMQALTRFMASAISAASTEKSIKQLRDRLFAHIQALPLAHFSKVPSGELIQRCTGDVDTVRRFIGTQVIELIRLLSVFVGAFVMMFMVHKVYAIIAIALVPLILITAYLFFKREGKVWQEHEEEQDKLTAIIQENLSGIRVVQAFAKEDFEIDKFVKQNKRKLKIGLQHVYLHMNFWTFSDFLVNGQVALSLLAGGYFTLNNAISVGEFASFFTYSIMVTWPMRGVGRIVSQMGMAAVAMERISQILDAEQEDYEGNRVKLKLDGDIEFKNVYFKYPKSDTYALKGVSFEVNAGHKVALLGPAGSGKSTIIALLGRYYEPESGEIILDGQPLKNYHKSDLRRRFGVVHQKPFLFSTTIRENIAYMKIDASDEEICEVANAASVDSFIEKLNNGYETMVGEKGVTLSGGQKQRVALARTLMGDPDILVLDDATSAVDTETEFAIQKALHTVMHGKTTFIIAHRLTSIQEADEIIVMEQGKIIEKGTHDALLKQKGFYKKVYDLQVSIEADIEKEILN
ncbi:MAG: ABC transporter ATP-binding protein [Bacteroidota bacterium]